MIGQTASGPGLRSRTHHGVAVLPYRVRVLPLPAVIDADGHALIDAHVLEIVFPDEMIDTPAGRMHAISGAGFAKVHVHGGIVRGSRYAD